MEQEELVFSVSSEEVDELIETTPPDQLVEKVAELIDWGKRAIHNANLEEKLTEQQIFELLSMKNVRDVPVLHRLIQENPTSTVELLKQITDEDQFSQLIFMKDDGCQENDDQSNSLSLAVFWERSDVVRCICTRLNKDNLYKLLCDPDENGNTALHYALWRDYSLDKLLEPFTAAESHKLLSIENNAGEIAGVSGWEVDELIETTPPDQLIKKLANLIGGDAIHNANLEEKLTEQQIFQLLSMRRFGDLPVLHELIENNPTSSTVKLLKQITDADQFKQLIFMKDDKYQYNSLSKAVFWNRSDVVRCIYTRLNKDNLYKLLHVQGKHGNTALHYASREDYPLDELLGPFTATESHKLLSIGNNARLTVDDMVQSLKQGASSQEIDRWFESTPSEVLIVRLAWSMKKWESQDLDRLSLEKRLTAGQIVDLLKANPGLDVDNPVLHWLIASNPTLTVKLLTQITNKDHFKQLTFMKDGSGQTVLSFCIKFGYVKSFQSLIKLYSDRQSELLDLATIPDNEGNTSFHYAAGMDTSDYLTALVQATLTFKLREMVAAALEKKNARNETVEPQDPWIEPLPANAIIYQWVQESTKNRQYVLSDYPKILVISNEADREGAKEEAKALIDCFQSLGLKVDVKPNREKKNMLDDLKEASKSKTGLIVAIMSHGGLGFIEDNERKEKIDIKDLEKSMTHHNCNTPKCLILQCCQGSGVEQSDETNRNQSKSDGLSNDAYRAEQPTASLSTETTDSSDTTPANTTLGGSSREDAGPSNKRIETYAPTSRHFCVFMSTVPGQPSQRNKFIPALVKAIEQLEPNECISEAFTVAVDELFLDLPKQKPLFQSTLMQKFCIKNVLPLVLKRSGVNDEGVVENIKSAVINEQGEGSGQTQGEAQAGEQAGAHVVVPKGDVGEALDGAVDGEPDRVIGGAVSGAAHGAVGSAQGRERNISTSEVTARRVTPRK